MTLATVAAAAVPPPSVTVVVIVFGVPAVFAVSVITSVLFVATETSADRFASASIAAPSPIVVVARSVVKAKSDESE